MTTRVGSARLLGLGLVVWTGLYEGAAPFEYAIAACGETFSITGE
jgi:hypothetical protein